MTRKTPLILALDTSTGCCTLALTRGTMTGGEILASISLNSRIRQSRRLLSTIDWMLLETEVDWSDIDGIAVGLGPGSFTGLRVGMATAKGLAVAAGKPLLGASTLDALASTCTTEKLICAVLDARKKQVYVAFYRLQAHRLAARTGDIRVVDPVELMDEIIEPVLMVGDGVLTYGELWKKGLGDNTVFAPPALHYPSASAIGLLCGSDVTNGRRLDLGSAAPLYVRASDAELSLEQRSKQVVGVGR